MTVKMPDAKSFMEELEKDHELVERKIVRLVYRYSATSRGVVYRLAVVASCRIAGQTVRFEESVGELWGLGLGENHGFKAADDEVMERAEKLSERIRTGCKDLGLEVRDGEFTAPTPRRHRSSA